MFRISAACLALVLVYLSRPAVADEAGRSSMARELVEATHLADKIGLILPRLEPMLRQALSLEHVSEAVSATAVKSVRNPSPDDLQKLMDQYVALYAR